MKFELVTICILLMVGTGMGNENCHMWMDMMLSTSGQGFESAMKIDADSEECAIELVSGDLTINIYEEKSRKNIFTKEERVNHTNVQLYKNTGFSHKCKYIPFDEMDLSSFKSKEYIYLDIEMVFKSDVGKVFTDKYNRIFRIP